MENYFARFEPDTRDGGYVVTFPDFGYGATQGETDEEANRHSQNAYRPLIFSAASIEIQSDRSSVQRFR
jgi:predicted RNase H-like HicB family nuclease